ncbi:unnamed protein product [marine sediment metagenome]|uniref:Uncharacterized protein n=1 Tax=marine sediment metagenome TaxID=412755 RepID=X1JZI3_9ZZZZ
MSAPDERGRNDIEEAVLELLFDNPLTTPQLARLAKVSMGEMEWVLARMEKRNIVYRQGGLWFIRTNFLVRRAMSSALSREDYPEDEFGKFLEGYAAGRKLGLTKAEAWRLARREMSNTRG